MAYSFNDGEFRVKVEKTPIGYRAIDAINYDYDYPIGEGDTLLESIADLRDKMVERGLWVMSCDM